MTHDTAAPPSQRVIGAEHFHTDDTKTMLRISRCRACGSSWFPARAQCSSCASRDVEEGLTANRGTAYACTVVRVGALGFPAPYVLAYVDIDDVRVLAHVTSATSALAPGTQVDLVAAPIAADADGPLLSYAVTASEVSR